MKRTFIRNSFIIPRSLSFHDKVADAARGRAGDASMSFFYDHGAPSYPGDYDSMGRRAWKKVETITPNPETGEETTTVTLHHRYIYRGYLQIATCDLTRSAHPCLWLITWNPTQPIATRPLSIQKDRTWYCYGWDLTKNICEIYSTTGYILTYYTYTPYGEVTAIGNTTQPIQWSSEHADTELGLIYYNYRYYNPTDGRWTRRDMVGEMAGLNIYDLVHNNPCIHIDYTGLFIDIIWDVGNMIWDGRVFIAGAISGDREMMEESATYFLLDMAAAAIPGVPAGVSKAARAAEKAAKQVEKETVRASKLAKGDKKKPSKPKKRYVYLYCFWRHATTQQECMLRWLGCRRWCT